MLNSLFPHGFTLIAILALLQYMLGVVGGYVARKNQENTSTHTLGTLLLVFFFGLVLSYLYYHFVWDMICRQYSC